VWAVIVAAGSGTRFGGAKQFAPLLGRPLVEWSVVAARAVCDAVVLVVPSDDVAQTAGHGADVTVAGGATRSGSVRAGLAAVPADVAVIVVHDGARPLASSALFQAVVDAVWAGADGAVPGLALADTVKRVDGTKIVGTVERQGLVAVQTPQAFGARWLRLGHRGEPEATDDAALVEAAGATVRVVPGDSRNIKVTTAEDLAVVEAWARGPQ
jgi:2-C-methyl-D-erythritol 4-phosphate cytidylyltransferase